MSSNQNTFYNTYLGPSKFSNCAYRTKTTKQTSLKLIVSERIIQGLQTANESEISLAGYDMTALIVIIYNGLRSSWA